MRLSWAKTNVFETEKKLRYSRIFNSQTVFYNYVANGNLNMNFPVIDTLQLTIDKKISATNGTNYSQRALLNDTILY